MFVQNIRLVKCFAKTIYVSSFWGTLGLLKGKMNREHNILEITKSPNALRQFLKEWKQNRPWLVDTDSETGMVC